MREKGDGGGGVGGIVACYRWGANVSMSSDTKLLEKYQKQTTLTNQPTFKEKTNLTFLLLARFFACKSVGQCECDPGVVWTLWWIPRHHIKVFLPKKKKFFQIMKLK